jgi:hypothetical protein
LGAWGTCRTAMRQANLAISSVFVRRKILFWVFITGVLFRSFVQ